MLLSLYFYVLKAGSSITNLEQFLTVLFNICMKEKKKKLLEICVQLAFELFYLAIKF